MNKEFNFSDELNDYSIVFYFNHKMILIYKKNNQQQYFTNNCVFMYHNQLIIDNQGWAELHLS